MEGGGEKKKVRGIKKKVEKWKKESDAEVQERNERLVSHGGSTQDSSSNARMKGGGVGKPLTTWNQKKNAWGTARGVSKKSLGKRTEILAY